MPSVEEFKEYLAFRGPNHTITAWQKKVHKLAVEKGFYDGTSWPDTKLLDQKLLLIVSEIVEAQTEIRNGHDAQSIYESSDGLKPEGFGIELADAVIRILDLAQYLNIDLEQCMTLKHEYNRSRPYKHGKVF